MGKVNAQMLPEALALQDLPVAIERAAMRIQLAGMKAAMRTPRILAMI